MKTIKQRAEEYATEVQPIGVAELNNFKYRDYIKGAKDQQKVDFDIAYEFIEKNIFNEFPNDWSLIRQNVIYCKLKKLMGGKK